MTNTDFGVTVIGPRKPVTTESGVARHPLSIRSTTALVDARRRLGCVGPSAARATGVDEGDRDVERTARLHIRLAPPPILFERECCPVKGMLPARDVDDPQLPGPRKRRLLGGRQGKEQGAA